MDNKKTIGLRELRENTEKYIKQVNQGKSFTVLRRNKAIFEITPLPQSNRLDWETVIDFSEIAKAGVSITKLQEALKDFNE